jgi:hypothetical protein
LFVAHQEDLTRGENSNQDHSQEGTDPQSSRVEISTGSNGESFRHSSQAAHEGRGTKGNDQSTLQGREEVRRHFGWSDPDPAQHCGAALGGP